MRGSELRARRQNPIVLGAEDSKATTRLSNVTRLDAADLDSFREALAAGQDVWFAMHIDGEVFSSVTAQLPVIPGWAIGSGAGHAMLIAGYTIQPNGTYYLIHNSWGETWADRGYAWIHEKTLKSNIISAYLVTL